MPKMAGAMDESSLNETSMMELVFELVCLDLAVLANVGNKMSTERYQGGDVRRCSWQNCTPGFVTSNYFKFRIFHSSKSPSPPSAP
mmetsp:Transcript_19015/g.36024  ORF Transcript_19015/g.36024 Transcript_19015/m.36024 type:complete len:86 (+) Transcript_19015:1214-1471(+)